MNKQSVEPEKLSLAILGAGGIGCYYGARLAKAGHGVSFIARGEHLVALQQNGLVLKHPDFDYQDAVEAYDINTLTRDYTPADFDAIIVCIKATATQEIAATLKSWFTESGESTMIVSLQNGVDNEPQLASSLGGDLIVGGLAVRIGGHIVRSGVVEATGVAQIILGAWPASNGVNEKSGDSKIVRLAEVFNKAGIPTRQVDNIRHELWRKLIINNGVNPLSALTGLDTHSLSHHPRFGHIVQQLMKETAMAAMADSEVLTEEDADEMYELICDFDPIKTSMLVDLEKGRKLEVDAICGVVIERAKKLGISVPYTETVYALLKNRLGE